MCIVIAVLVLCVCSCHQSILIYNVLHSSKTGSSHTYTQGKAMGHNSSVVGFRGVCVMSGPKIPTYVEHATRLNVFVKRRKADHTGLCSLSVT